MFVLISAGTLETQCLQALFTKKYVATRAKHLQDPCYQKISLGCKINETELGVT